MVIEEAVIIHATTEKVWKTFTDLSCWMIWNNVMRDVSSDQKLLAPGSHLSCSIRPFLFPISLRISVEKVMPFDRVLWSAKKKGLFALHEFLFRKHEDGVMVRSRETFTGLLAKGDGFFLPVKRMRALTEIFLEDLKKASES